MALSTAAIAAAFTCGCGVRSDRGPASTATPTVIADNEAASDPALLADAAPKPTTEWRPDKDVRSVTAPLDDLRSLPYLSSAKDPHGEASGVLVHDPSRAFDGYTLYGPRTRATAYLIDMNGEVVWKWRGAENSSWHHTELLPEGGLLVSVKARHVQRLDLRSQVVWETKVAAHHDLWVKDGTVWVPATERRVVPALHASIPVEVEKIVLLRLEDGTRIGEIDLLDMLLRSDHAYLLPVVAHRRFDAEYGALDLIHNNHVEVFDGRHRARSPIFREGNVLVSLRNINTILIFDPDTKMIEWLWGPSNLAFQHHPTVVGDGNLLLFNNGTKQSSVLELDPIERRVVWEYTAPTFFSRTRGSVQRLPNGNTLITESDTGHFFEVTPNGDRVWEFANPEIDEENKRAAVWRATRFARGDIDFLP